MEVTPEERRRRRRRFNVFLGLALADVLAAGLSWIAPIAGYVAVGLTIAYVLLASHLAVVARRMLDVAEGGGKDAADDPETGSTPEVLGAL